MRRTIQRGDPYPSKILKLMPGEIVATFLAINGFVQGQTITLAGVDITRWFLWGVFATLLMLTPIYLWKLQEVSDKTQLLFSTVALVVWVYALGGPFQAQGWYQPQIASTVLALYTLFIPLMLGERPAVARSSGWRPMT